MEQDPRSRQTTEPVEGAHSEPLPTGSPDRLAQDLGRVAELAARHGADRIGNLARETAGRLVAHVFNIAVFGEFKRGKSTLLNALIGQSLLPSGAIPVTSVITRVSFGERESAQVRFIDGRDEAIPVGSLREYVAEKDNPKNRKKVAAVEVQAPAPLLQNGTCLIDTPGTGSIHTHNTDLAIDFLDRADVAILVLTADSPISERELSLWESLNSRFPAVFAVINKCDVLSPHDRSEVVRFTQDALSRVDSATPSVYPLSARKALDAKSAGDGIALEQSGLPQLERRLTDFLRSSREEASIQSATGTLRRCCQQLQQRLAFEKLALTSPLVELERNLEGFSRALDGIRSEQDNELFLLRERTRRKLIGALQDDLSQFQAEHAGKGFNRLMEQILPKMSSGSALEAIREANRLMPDLVEQDFLAFKEDEMSRLTGRMVEAAQSLASHTQKWVDQIQQLSSDLFHCPIPVSVDPPRLRKVSGFWVKRWYARIELGALQAAVLSVLRARIVQGWISRRLRRKIWELYDMNCGNMRYEFQRRLDGALTEYAAAVQTWIEEACGVVEKTIDRLVEKRRESAAGVEPLLAELEKDMALVNVIASRYAA